MPTRLQTWIVLVLYLSIPPYSAVSIAAGEIRRSGQGAVGRNVQRAAQTVSTAQADEMAILRTELNELRLIVSIASCIRRRSSSLFFFLPFSSFFFLWPPPVQPHLFYPHRPAAACIPVALFWSRFSVHKRNQCTLASREMNPPPPISCLPLTPL